MKVLFCQVVTILNGRARAKNAFFAGDDAVPAGASWMSSHLSDHHVQKRKRPVQEVILEKDDADTIDLLIDLVWKRECGGSYTFKWIEVEEA